MADEKIQKVYHFLKIFKDELFLNNVHSVFRGVNQAHQILLLLELSLNCTNEVYVCWQFVAFR
jgi:hypothetical protein